LSQAASSSSSSYRLSPWVGSAGILLFVFAIAAGLIGFKMWQVSQMAAQGAPPEAPTFVRLEKSSSFDFRQRSTAIGTIVAPRSIVLSNEVAGTVAKTYLPAGGIVEAGTVLVELDTSIESAQLRAAEAAASMAESRYTRTKEARRNNALTELELDEAEGEWIQAQSLVAELQAVIAKKRLVTPFRATVGLSDTHEGQYLPSGSEITSLQSVDDYLHIDFNLPQQVADWIEVGQAVQLDYDQRELQAEVVAKDSRTDPLTRNQTIRARLDLAPDHFKPGDSVKVQVEYGPIVSAVAVPVEAVRRTPNGPRVFVAQPDQQGQLRAQERPVEVARTVHSRALILEGIRENETVVTSGSFKLADGGLLQEVETNLPDASAAE
jgi:membrane fusion protein, multidrug efflux system